GCDGEGNSNGSGTKALMSSTRQAQGMGGNCLPLILEHIKNKIDTRRSRASLRSGYPLGPRHLAVRAIGHVAVEADDAPFNPPAKSDHAGILGNGIMDDALAAVGNLHNTAAEAAGDGIGCPGSERGLANLLELN